MKKCLSVILAIGVLVTATACGGGSDSSSCTEGEVRCDGLSLETCTNKEWVAKTCNSTCQAQHYSGASACEYSAASKKDECVCKSCVAETPDFCFSTDSIPVCDTDGTWKGTSCKNWCNLADNGDFLDGESCTKDSVGATCDCFDCKSYVDCPASEDMCDLDTMRCVDSYQFTWRVNIYNGVSSEKNADGDNWDPGGLPDLFVTMYVNDEPVYTTAFTDDSLGATWDEYFDYQFDKTAKVEFALWDDDTAVSDYIGSVVFNTTYGEIPAGVFEGGGFVYESTEASGLLVLSVFFSRVE